jgi:antitoxin component YwqK of YwqJK toxin-antitoxin module
MKKNTIVLILGCLLGISGYAQKLVRSYYDYNHTKVKEEYYTDNYGVKTGSYKFYSEFGGILVQGTYKKDKLAGHWITKDEKGALVADENYDDEGNFNGQVLKYSDGHLVEQNNYVHGNKSGICKTWYTADNGGENAYKQIHEQENFIKSSDGSDSSVYKEYFPNGKISNEGVKVNRIKEGVWHFYFDDGSPKESDTYKFGVLCGDCYRFSFYRCGNGNLGIISKYEHYVLTGRGLAYDPSYVDAGRIDSLDVGEPNVSVDSSHIYVEKVIANQRNLAYRGIADKQRKDSLVAVTAAVDRRKSDSVSNIEKEKQELLQHRKDTLSDIQQQVESLYTKFKGLYVVIKQATLLGMPLVDNQTQQPVMKATYPNGEHLFFKSDTLIKFMQVNIQVSTDINFQLATGKNIEAILNKLISLSGTDTKDLDKQMKKAETMNEIKKILGY